MNLEELKVYQLSMKLGDSCWKLVDSWNYFQKDTIGKQLVRSADSVAANLSEGYGRFHFKENRQFCFYSRGSLFETKTWLVKASNRELISNDIFDQLRNEMNEIGKMLNGYIKSIGNKNNLEEPEVEYRNRNKPEEIYFE
jgi:four helix bundle protein